MAGNFLTYLSYLAFWLLPRLGAFSGVEAAGTVGEVVAEAVGEAGGTGVKVACLCTGSRIN